MAVAADEDTPRGNSMKRWLRIMAWKHLGTLSRRWVFPKGYYRGRNRPRDRGERGRRSDRRESTRALFAQPITAEETQGSADADLHPRCAIFL